jgi:hypothetical protein
VRAGEMTAHFRKPIGWRSSLPSTRKNDTQAVRATANGRKCLTKYAGINDFAVPGTNAPTHPSYWHELLALAGQSEESWPRVATHSYQAMGRRRFHGAHEECRARRQNKRQCTQAPRRSSGSGRRASQFARASRAESDLPGQRERSSGDGHEWTWEGGGYAASLAGNPGRGSRFYAPGTSRAEAA